MWVYAEGCVECGGSGPVILQAHKAGAGVEPGEKFIALICQRGSFLHGTVISDTTRLFISRKRTNRVEYVIFSFRRVNDNECKIKGSPGLFQLAVGEIKPNEGIPLLIRNRPPPPRGKNHEIGIMNGEVLFLIIIADNQVVMTQPAFSSQSIRLEAFFDHHWKPCSEQGLNSLQVTAIPPESMLCGVFVDEIHQLVRHHVHILRIGFDHCSYRVLIFAPVIIGEIHGKSSRSAVVHMLLFALYASQ